MFQTNKKTADFFIVMILIIVSLIYGMHYISLHHKESAFYQNQFSPSVAMACGKGLHAIPFGALPSLDKFLNQKKATFNCSDINSTTPTEKLNFFQQEEKYLMFSTGLVWKFTGVGWSKLYPLFAIMFAISIIACYGLFRLGVNPLLALLGTGLIFYFDFLAYYIPQLRDYSPATFCLPFIFFMGLIVKTPYNAARLIIYSSLAAIFLGFGLGFRPDMLAYAPAVPFVIFLFTQSPINKHLISKCIAFFAFVFFFLALSLPIFYGIKTGSNLYHVIIEGYSPSFTAALHVSDSPIYFYISRYNDSLTYKVIASFGYRVLHEASLIPMPSKLYDHVGAHMLMSIIANFPGDFITRCFASVWQILYLPYKLLGLKYGYSAHLMEVLRYTSLIIALIVITTIRHHSFKYATFILLAILYIGAYPVLQFSPRHYFYLVFIAIWLVLVAIEYLYTTGWRCFSADKTRHSNLIDYFNKKFVIQMVTFVAVPILVIILLISVTRLYQTTHLKSMFQNYLMQPRKEINYNVSKESNGNLLLQVRSMENQNNFGLKSAYLIAHVNSSACEFPTVYLEVKYAVNPPYNKTYNDGLFYNPSFVEKFPAHNNPTIFIPIYQNKSSHFVGIEVPKYEKNCISSIQQVANIKATPLMFPLILPKDWKSKRLYQKIAAPSLPPTSLPKQLNTSPATIKIPRGFWKNKPSHNKITSHENMLQKKNNKLLIEGKPKLLTSYLASFEKLKITEQKLSKYNYYFVAKGKLYHGGLVLGLQKDNIWTQILYQSAEQPFKLVIKVSKPGEYVPMLANQLNPGQSNHAIISKYGWVIIPKS